jgi:hypothetical protein
MSEPTKSKELLAQVIRTTIRHWWNDTARKYWREYFADPDQRDHILEDLTWDIVQKLSNTGEPTSLQPRLEFLQARTKELENQIQLLRSATCGRCGRSLPPDGDCHGCEADLLHKQVTEMTHIIAGFLIWSDQINDPDLLKRARTVIKPNPPPTSAQKGTPP